MRRREVTVVRGDDRYRYSSGEVVEALQGAGVLTDAALSITSSLEGQLRSRATKEIDLDELLSRIERLIRERINSSVATRFMKQTPPFVPLMIEQGDSGEPLSTRKLTNSLESFGLSFKQANAVARQVEQVLRTQGYESVPRAVLGHAVAIALEAGLGREVRMRYEASLSRPAELHVVEADGGILPYSRGVLARSVMAIGLGPEMAYRLANLAEDELWRGTQHRVPRSQVRALLIRLLTQEAGEDFARRYEVLHSLRSFGEPIVVLVGGAPGVGKSTIASELAYRLGVSRLVSTDSIREALRSLIGQELSPVLHASTFDAWKAELLPEERGDQPGRRQVVRGFMAQVRQLGPAIHGIINRSLEEASQLVLEGVHLVPGASNITPESFPGALVIPLVLTVEDEESHRDHFAVRERQTSSRRAKETYIRHFREVRFLHDYLRSQARATGVHTVDATDVEEAVDQALRHVLATMFDARGARPGSSGD